jgi:class 3 adenylate cyclase/predicted ATPase
VEEWLRTVGLGERVAAFQAHGIAADQLHELTDDDLRELGLTIGERKRFRRALHERALAEAEAETTQAERRPLTMMFVDMVNSSGLSLLLDAEDMMEVVQRYRVFCGAAITRTGGMIARVVGDGILAYFCYPIANENDPERAVRAALDIARDIAGVEMPPDCPPVAVRIGIATGRVIVSDLFAGSETTDRRSIIGATPNLAARLQALAPAGGIVIADETHARIGHLFDCVDLGAQALRGFDVPQRAWRVLGENRLGRPSGAAHPQRLTPFFGRRAELQVLAERWSRASAGSGGALLVLGEAGIGKSRLLETFLASRLPGNGRVLRVNASPLDEDSALHPIIAMLRRRAGFDAEAETEEKVARLRALALGEPAMQARALPILARLLDLPAPETAHYSPAQLREQTLQVLCEQLLAMAAERPLCLVVEDLHWVDPSTRDLLDRVVRQAPRHHLMLLMTARDGFEAPWLAGRDTTILRLVRLAAEDVAGMVRSLFGETAVPAHLGRLIARKTDGVPLFVEEVARAMLTRAEGHGAGRSFGLDAEMLDEPDAMIPASLHEALIARLDRSGPTKTIAQVAGVVGRSVGRALLATVCGLPQDELDRGLRQLVDAGVLFRDDVEGRESYTFSHALVRDAAYDMLLRDRRRAMHLAVAAALRDDPDRADLAPEVLALHLSEGGAAREAAPLWMEAARRSLARSALTEATRLLRRGLAALERLPVSPETERATTDLRLQMIALLGPALIAVKGPGVPETTTLYGDAYALAESIPEKAAHFPIYWGWWRVAKDFHVSHQRATTLLRRAQHHGDPELLLQAHHCCWASRYHLGEFDACGEHIAEGLAIYGTADYRHHARLYGNHDARVCAHGAHAHLLWLQGRLRAAAQEERASKAWAAEIDHLGSRIHALDFSAIYRVLRHDIPAIHEAALALIEHGTTHGLADHRAKGLMFRGWSQAIGGNLVAGLAAVEDGFAQQGDLSTNEDMPVYLTLYAQVLAAAGKPDRAVETIARLAPEFEASGLRFWAPEILRVQAEVTYAADPAAIEAARTLCEQALTAARALGSPMLALRAARSLSRLERAAGHETAGLATLRAALADVPEPDDSHDILLARRLLGALQDAPC